MLINSQSFGFPSILGIDRIIFYISPYASRQSKQARVRSFFDVKKQLVEVPAHWYTNIPIINRPKYKNLKIVPLKDIPEKYKKYDDNGILNLYNFYIPNNYNNKFAASTDPILNGLLEKGYKIVDEKGYTPYINGKECFRRVLVQRG